MVKGAAATTAGAWATGGSLNTGRRAMGGAGTQTAALGIGGNSNPGSPPFSIDIANTESYDGTSWTEVNDLNTGRKDAGGSGTDNTSALIFGGDGVSKLTATEEWNGVSWAETSDLNTAVGSIGGTGTAASA